MKKLIFENFGLKISAVLLSVFLWLFVTSRGQSEISLDIPLEYKNIPVGLGMVNNAAKTAVVTIRGQDRLIKGLRPSDLRVLVDLSKAKKGEGTYFIGRDDIKLPYAVSVINVTPTSVKIRMEETVREMVAVNPTLRGAAGEGYFVKSVQAEPRSIVIEGLKSEVRKVKELKTEPLDISGAKETVSQEVEIDTSGAIVKPEVGSVKVTAIIKGKGK